MFHRHGLLVVPGGRTCGTGAGSKNWRRCVGGRRQRHAAPRHDGHVRGRRHACRGRQVRLVQQACPKMGCPAAAAQRQLCQCMSIPAYTLQHAGYPTTCSQVQGTGRVRRRLRAIGGVRRHGSHGGRRLGPRAACWVSCQPGWQVEPHRPGPAAAFSLHKSHDACPDSAEIASSWLPVMRTEYHRMMPSNTCRLFCAGRAH